MPKAGSRSLACVLALQAVLGGLYVARIGIFNAPDEPAHTAYVDHLSATGNRPDARASGQYEGIQPPLYYALAAPLHRLTKGLPAAARVRALRAQNLCYALLNVWLIFFLISRVADEPTALAGAAFAALLPQYLFISSSVTNDSLADLLSTGMLTLGVIGLEPKRPAWWPWATGLVIGLGLLTKLSVLGVLGALILVYALRQPRALLAPLALGLTLGAWPLWRNFSLYGDFAGHGAMAGYDSPMRAAEFFPWLVTLFKSFCGLFAWMASPLPGPVYGLLAALALAGIAGFTRRQERLSRPAAELLTAAVVLVCLQAFYTGFLRTRQPQGRYLFPALAPIALVLAAGWRHWWRKLAPDHRAAAGAAAAAGVLTLQVLSLRAL